jgi:hypothetical protein
MALKRYVVGCFADEAVLFPAVRKVRNAGYKIQDVYTPFPVHGLDHALGHERNKSSYCRALFMVLLVLPLRWHAWVGFLPATGQ